MEKLTRNQLAEIIIEDGQPARAMYNYLKETMELLKRFKCVNDYSSKDLKITKYAIDKNIFLSSLSSVLRSLKEKDFKFENLYHTFDYSESDLDDEYEEGNCDIKSFNIEDWTTGYYLRTAIKENSCNVFLIKTGIEEPFLANINVHYSGMFMDKYSDKKFEFLKSKKQFINFSVCGTDGEVTKEFEIKEIDFIIPFDCL
jgi:hypothetical protein